MQLPQWLSWLPFGEVPEITAESASRELEHYTLIDVRSVSEFNKNHIPGAISIPLYQLNQSSITKLSRHKPFICICLSAHRSKPATRTLIRAGLDARELKGGMLAWWKAQLPTEDTRD